jgi:hypothetical protein
MSEEQTSYKVTDRRLFNPDGTPRDVPENERPEPAPTKPEAASALADTSDTVANAAGAVRVEAAASKVSGATSATKHETINANRPEPELEEDEDLPGADDPAGFPSFLMSIASNAASALGMMEHPVTHKREVDLELGKHWIDVLGMLEKKTRGNLLAQEQQILEGLLADLRMQFVSLSNATPKARSFSSQDITGG